MSAPRQKEIERVLRVLKAGGVKIDGAKIDADGSVWLLGPTQQHIVQDDGEAALEEFQRTRAARRVRREAETR